MVKNFYKHLFLKDNSVQCMSIVDFPTLPERKIRRLNKEVTNQEIKNVDFSMEGLKALCIDGLNALFFSKLVGSSGTYYVLLCEAYIPTSKGDKRSESGPVNLNSKGRSSRIC